MNFNEAAKLMGEGKAVESLVSCTTYEMSKEGLLAEGLQVSFDHLTTEEANGKWREVEVIETMEEFSELSEEQVVQILDSIGKQFDFNEKYRSK